MRFLLHFFLQGSKKFKRLKKAQRDLDEDRFGISDDEFDGSMKGGTTAEEKLKRTLFGDDDGSYIERILHDHYYLDSVFKNWPIYIMFQDNLLKIFLKMKSK